MFFLKFYKRLKNLQNLQIVSPSFSKCCTIKTYRNRQFRHPLSFVIPVEETLKSLRLFSVLEIIECHCFSSLLGILDLNGSALKGLML